ncbi:FliC/FljB family flagellin [Variovorax boronicumulans]
MAQVINTNSLSLLTQNNLNKSQSALNTAIERLSSGMRINSAKDDAAGQAIANRFTANIKGLTQASRNANDGISIAQTTEGALTEVNNNLQRIRDLSVQAATGTNSATDLDSIQSEIGQRLDEINRVSEQTQFNGVKVLSANAGKLTVQVGANDGETIDIDLKEISAKTLGLESFNVNGTGTLNKAATKDDLTLAGAVANGAPVNGTQKYDVTATNTLATRSQLLAGAKAGDSVATAGSTYSYDAAKSKFTFGEADRTNANTVASLKPPAGESKTATVTIGGTSLDVKIDSAGTITATDGSALFVDGLGNLTQNSAGAGVQSATLTTLTDSMAAAAGTGGTIKVGGTTYTANAAAAGFDVTGDEISAAALNDKLAAGAGTAVTASTIGGVAGVTIAADGTVAGAFVGADGSLGNSLTTVSTYSVHSNGAVTDGAGNSVYADSAKAGAFTLNARSGSTSTVDPLKALDAALSKVDQLRSSLGAVQNRFDSVIANLGTTITNLSSSRSRIEDSDYAVEVSNMTRAQILQQAGTSVLAQANQTTQGVLSLLR